MLDDPFTHTASEVQAAMSGLPLLKVLHDAKGMQVVVEASAVITKAAIQRTLSRMTEGRMPDIVHQSEGFSKICVQPKRRRSGTRDLCHLDGMGQPTAKVIGRPAGEDLRLPGKASES